MSGDLTANGSYYCGCGGLSNGEMYYQGQYRFGVDGNKLLYPSPNLFIG